MHKIKFAFRIFFIGFRISLPDPFPGIPAILNGKILRMNRKAIQPGLTRIREFIESIFQMGGNTRTPATSRLISSTASAKAKTTGICIFAGSPSHAGITTNVSTASPRKKNSTRLFDNLKCLVMVFKANTQHVGAAGERMQISPF